MHQLRLFFANDRRFRRLMRLYWAERMIGAATDRMIKLYTQLRFKRKRAFKEYARRDKRIMGLFRV